MKMLQKGFTLIELMIVVAIIGIVAAVALPVYQDYTVRAKASELLLAASVARTSVAMRFQGEPSNTASAGAGVTIPITGRLSAATVGEGGTIVINGNATATSTGQAITITFTPSYSTATGTVTWSCVGSPARYLPASCR